ncbi:MAG: hypothetical protein HZB33_02190 [Nitrospirae bacterium]|nr:hypothetical protein [Nitrospirota bacterium]
MRNNHVLSQQGFIKGILWMFVLIALGYAGISFGQPYYRYNTLRSHTKDMILMDIGDINTIKARVLKEAAELKVPLTEENLDVSITEKKVVKVKGRWSETVNFWDYYSKTIDFELDVEN